MTNKRAPRSMQTFDHSTASRFKLTTSSRQTFHAYKHRDLASSNSIYIYIYSWKLVPSKKQSRSIPSQLLSNSFSTLSTYLVVIRRDFDGVQHALFDRSTFAVRSLVMGSSASQVSSNLTTLYFEDIKKRSDTLKFSINL